MYLDSHFEALAGLAREGGDSLQSLGEQACLSDDSALLGIRECCHLFSCGEDPWPAWATFYLATLDELIRVAPLQSVAREALWKKLVSRHASQFLDTVVEAAWYLHLAEADLHPTLEQPFFASTPGSPNADVGVVRNGRPYWLDAYSIQLTELEPPHPFGVVPSADRAARVIADRAASKYFKKFQAHAQASVFQGASVGILLCVIKSERVLLPSLRLTGVGEVPPPLDLFADPGRAALDLVVVHSLRPRNSFPSLRPWILLQWVRSEEHRIAGAARPCP